MLGKIKTSPVFKAFFGFVHAAVLGVIDNLCLIFPVKATPSSKKKLLIVRPDGIGDFIIFLDTFKEYGKLYPSDKWEITLLGNRAWTDLAERLPYSDENLFLDRKKFLSSPLHRFRILRKVRQTAFDTVIYPAFSREYFYGDAVVRVCAAGNKIGSEGDMCNIQSHRKKKSDRWYTKLIPSSKGPMNELDLNAEFIRGLGLDNFISSAPLYPLEVLPEPEGIISDTGIPYFVIAPSASWVGKRWPKERFAELASLLNEQTGWTPVLCGEPNDTALAEEIMNDSPELPWKDLTGRLNLPGLMWLLRGGNMLVSNDSGVVHMAAAVGCPSLCIMGGGHFKRFFPYGDPGKNRIVYKKMDCYDCNWHCIYPVVKCLEEVTVDDAWEEASIILKSIDFEIIKTGG